MTDPDETRTRAQLEATLKDELVVFNQHIRNINKPTRRIHAVSAKPNVVAEELQNCVCEYESILEELSADTKSQDVNFRRAKVSVLLNRYTQLKRMVM